MKPTIAALFLLLAGLAVRLPHLADPPLDFHPTRQYRSAILARAYALDGLPGLTPAERTAAELAARGQPTIEPPIMEHAAALAYRALGREDLRIPRLIAALSWVAGAAAVWWLAWQLFGSVAAATAGAAACLFIPFGITASQAFQPDPLMTALTFITVALIARHDTRRGALRLMLWMATGAAAIVVKPMAAFFMWPVALALAVRRHGFVRGAGFGAFTSLVMSLPAAAWYVFAAPDAAEERLFPQLLATAAFWTDWLRMIDLVVWIPIAVLGLAGAAMARGRASIVMLSLWAGYLAFGMAFTYHIHTHTYYSLPLIPVVALSLSALIFAIDRRLHAASSRRVAGWIGAATLAAGAAASIQAAGVLQDRPELRQMAADLEEIGTLVGHSHNVAALDGYYAFPLDYHGLVTAHNWPLSIDRAAVALSGRALPSLTQMLQTDRAEFFVGTNQAELEMDPDLLPMLEDRYALIGRGGPPDRWRYVVFDLRRRKPISTNPSRVSLFALTDASAASRTAVQLTAPAELGWHVSPASAESVRVIPDRGVGPATLTLAPVPSRGEIDRTVEVAIHVGTESLPATRLLVRVRTLAAPPVDMPIGAVDDPPPSPPASVSAGPVHFRGWVLDGFDSRGARFEAADAAGRTIDLGLAPGSSLRPDVAKLFPNLHDVFHPGWTFDVRGEMLNGLTFPVTIHVYSEAGDGRRSEIGSRQLVGR